MYLGGLTIKITQIVPMWERVPPSAQGKLEVLGGRLGRWVNHQRA